MNDNLHMKRAIELASDAAAAGEVPVGAVLVDWQSGEVVAEARNEVEALGDITAHAELSTIKNALLAKQRSMCEQQASMGKKPNVSNEDKYLSYCDLYVTLEPCAMCAGAIAHARIRRVIFGAYDPKSGGVEHGPKIFSHQTTHHKPEIIGGVEEGACAALLTTFFQGLR